MSAALIRFHKILNIIPKHSEKFKIERSFRIYKCLVKKQKRKHYLLRQYLKEHIKT